MRHFFYCLCGFAIFFIISLSGCAQAGTENNNHSQSDAVQNGTDSILTEENEVNNTAKTIETVINGKKFEILLYANETARAFANMLPLTLEMKELNGNEKYHYLDESMPSDPSRVESISCGDLMLYGSDCIVLFYKNFSTAYRYTKIGKINDAAGLEQALGAETATITFQIK